MTQSPRIESYSEFWKFYVGEHSNATCRKLHFLGTSCALTAIVLGIAVSPRWFIAAPFFGYFFAWIGHFFFEKNRPATFKYPLWSLMGDFQMYGTTLMGRMSDQVALYAKK